MPARKAADPNPSPLIPLPPAHLTKTMMARGFRILEEAYEGYLALDDGDGQLRVLERRALGLWAWGDKPHRQEALKLLQQTADKCWEMNRDDSERFLGIQHTLAVWYYSGVGVDGGGNGDEHEMRGVNELEKYLRLLVKKATTTKRCEQCLQVRFLSTAHELQ